MVTRPRPRPSNTRPMPRPRTEVYCNKSMRCISERQSRHNWHNTADGHVVRCLSQHISYLCLICTLFHRVSFVEGTDFPAPNLFSKSTAEYSTLVAHVGQFCNFCKSLPARRQNQLRGDNLSGWLVLDLSLFCCATERQYTVKQGLGRQGQGQGQGLVLQGQGLILPRPRPKPLNLVLRPRPNITDVFAVFDVLVNAYRR